MKTGESGLVGKLFSKPKTGLLRTQVKWNELTKINIGTIGTKNQA